MKVNVKKEKNGTDAIRLTMFDSILVNFHSWLHEAWLGHWPLVQSPVFKLPAARAHLEIYFLGLYVPLVH